MKKIFQNYKASIILIGSVIIGAIIGLVFGSKATVLSPLGDLFLNLLLVVVVPLIFLTLTTAIGKMKNPKRVGKILSCVLLVFLIMSVVSCLTGIGATKLFSLINMSDQGVLKSSIDLAEEGASESVNFLERTINTISVSDFSKILTRDNMVALIMFSMLIGISINLSGEKAKPFLDVLESANSVIQKFILLIMYYAPIGLGCYFASLIGSYGKEIAVGYLRTFVIYFVVCILFYIIAYSIYAFIAGGKDGLKSYWSHILPATFTALGTCSSAACIPVNVECATSIGVPEDIANTAIPLGTNFHKDGSIIGSVFKIMFLVELFGLDISTAKVLGISLLATLLITAVPIGGGTISETLIIAMLGVPYSTLGLLTIIATIIDAPATALNVVGDTASSMLVTRIIDGKNWLTKKFKKA